MGASLSLALRLQQQFSHYKHKFSSTAQMLSKAPKAYSHLRVSDFMENTTRVCSGTNASHPLVSVTPAS